MSEMSEKKSELEVMAEESSKPLKYPPHITTYQIGYVEGARDLASRILEKAREKLHHDSYVSEDVISIGDLEAIIKELTE